MPVGNWRRRHVTAWISQGMNRLRSRGHDEVLSANGGLRLCVAAQWGRTSG
jgi:hypothetical protein